MNELNLTGNLDSKNRIVLQHLRHFIFALEEFKGWDLNINISKKYEKRSTQQNRWLWGVAYVEIRNFIFETQGEELDLDEIHYFNMTKVQNIKPKRVVIDGEEVLILKKQKSSEWTTKEFNDRKVRLQEYCASKWGLVIKDPNEK